MKKIINYLIFIVLMAICDVLDTLEQHFYIGLSIRPFRQLFFVLIIPLYVLFVLVKIDRKYVVSVLLWTFGVWNIVYGILLPFPIEGGYYWLDPIFISPVLHWLITFVVLYYGFYFYCLLK